MISTDIRALLLVDAERPLKYDPIPLAAPPALHEVAGLSPLLRIASRLWQSEIPSAVVATETSFSPPKDLWPTQFEWRSSSEDRLWRTAEDCFNEAAQNGAQLIFLVRRSLCGN